MEAQNNVPIGFLRVALKNPKREKVVEQRIHAGASVRELKVQIEEQYPDNPPRELITLVYAGKVLRDDAILHEVFDVQGFESASSGAASVAVHMVVRHPEQTPTTNSGLQSDTIMPAPSSARTSNTGGHVDGRMDEVENGNEGDDEDVAQERCVEDVPGIFDGRINADSESVREGAPTPGPTQRSDPTHSVRSMSSRPSGAEPNVYSAVLKASYEAALRTIMDDRAASHASGYTFIPAMIPVPQSAVAGHRRHRRRQRRNDEGANDEEEAHMGYLRAIFGPLDLNEVRDRRGLPRMPRPAGEENGPNEARNDAGNNNGNRREYQIRIHINVRMLFQLVLAGFILYQHCPPSRMLTLGLVGLFFYLSTTQLGRRALRRVLQGRQMPRENRGANGRAEPVVEQQQRHGQQPDEEQRAELEQPPRVGWLREAQSFVLSFLASLLPAADDVARMPENNGVAQGVLGVQ